MSFSQLLKLKVKLVIRNPVTMLEFFRLKELITTYVIITTLLLF